MKSFFENYGFTILAAIVVILLIAITGPIGNLIRDNISHFVEGFGDKTLQRLDAIDDNRIPSGTVIRIDDLEYTIIEHVKGNQYKVLANELANNGNFMTFDTNNLTEYKTSTIAAYLDSDYYNRLDPKIQNAIVETSIQQKVSSSGWDNGNNSPKWTGETKDAGTYKVFVPSWEEITKAAGGTTPEILKTLLNSEYVWLRDTCGNLMLFVHFNSFLDFNSPDHNGYYARPAMVLDLSKESYTIK